jgi:chromosome partitioning protein
MAGSAVYTRLSSRAVYSDSAALIGALSRPDQVVWSNWASCGGTAVQLLVGGIKGGTGKSTLAANLGIERSRQGKKVILVDADPDQESLSDYIANRDEHNALPSVPIVQVKGSTTAKSLRALGHDFDEVIIDCGGFDSIELRQAALITHAWVVPLNPSQMQIWTMPKLKTVLDEANAMRGDAQLTGWLLGMRISTNPYSSANHDLQAVAEAFPGFATLRTVVHQRAAFEKAEKLGLAVTELEKPNASERRARDSIRQLHQEIYGSFDAKGEPNG